MAEANWLRHALRMGVFDYRRSVRAIRDDTARLIMMGVSVFLPTALLAGMAVLFAPDVRGVDPEFAVNSTLRGTLALFWLFVVFMLAQRTTTAHSEVVNAPFVLTTVSPWTAVVGGIVAETLRVLTYVLPYAILLLVVGTYVFTAPTVLLVVPLAGCLFVTSAVVLGRVLGYTAAWLIARVPVIARHKGVLGVLLVFAFFGGYALFQIPGLPVSISPAVLAMVPIGWLADVTVIGTPIGWSPGHVAGGLGTAGFVLVGGTWAAAAIASSLWFGDEVAVSDNESAASTPSNRAALAHAISPLTVPVVTGTVRSVAEWSILRTRREPERLNILFIPVFAIVGSQVSSAIQAGGSLGILAPAIAVTFGWLVGAAFGLNPFGDEGAVLPVTLLSSSGRDVVRGLIAPSVLFQPLVVLSVVVAGIIGGLNPIEIIALSGIGCGVATVGAALAPAIGMRFPRFSAIRIGNSDGVRPPRMLAAGFHVVLTWVPGAALAGLVVRPTWVRTAVAGIGYLPGFVLGLIANDGPVDRLATLCTDLGAAIHSVPLVQFRTTLAVALVVGGVLVARRAYNSAVRQFETHEPHRS